MLFKELLSFTPQNGSIQHKDFAFIDVCSPFTDSLCFNASSTTCLTQESLHPVTGTSLTLYFFFNNCIQYSALLHDDLFILTLSSKFNPCSFNITFSSVNNHSIFILFYKFATCSFKDAFSSVNAQHARILAIFLPLSIHKPWRLRGTALKRSLSHLL